MSQPFMFDVEKNNLMTQPFSFITALKSLLPEETWPQVIPALCTDAVVWDRLQEQSFGELALEKIGSTAEGWNPAALAFLDLDQEELTLQDELDSTLLQSALGAFEDLVKNRKQGELEARPLSLAQSGLLAIALHEHRKRAGTWQGLRADLRALPPQIWGTPLACLYGLVEDRLDLIKALAAPDAAIEFQGVALHAILSNPAPLSDQAKILHEVLTGLPLEDCAHMLAKLKTLRPDFATQMARLFLDQKEPITSADAQTSDVRQLHQISGYLRDAEIHTLAELPSQAAALRNLALQVTRKLHLEIATQLANASAGKGEMDEAMAYWDSSADLDVDFEALRRANPPLELILALIQSGHPQDALALIHDHEAGPSDPVEALASLAAASRDFQSGNLEAARENARRCLDKIHELLSPGIQTLALESSLEPLSWRGATHELADLLLDLSLPLQAIQAFDLALALQPDDPGLLVEKGRAQRVAGDIWAAIETAQLAVALDPNQAALRRELIRNLETNDQWGAALLEREALLDERFSASFNHPWPLHTDLIDLARCALRAEEPQRSIQICEQILDSEPTDSGTQTILGEALAAGGQIEAGLTQIQKVTQSAPHLSDAWLALARVRKAAGENAKAIETLRTASNAITADPRISFALAQAYLAERSHTQALSYLQQAYRICNSGAGNWVDGDPRLLSQIALQLGSTLVQLGHLEDARRVLEETYREHPLYPGLAYAYAHSLLSLNEPDKALGPLQIAMGFEPENPNAYIDYAQALLETGKDPDQAIRRLQIALHLLANGKPDLQANAQGLLAEALAAAGEKNAALQAYYHAMDTPLAEDPAWAKRLSFGLGQVALDLDQPEIAVANLQGAAQLDPNDPRIQRSLAQAYVALDLWEEALSAARKARDLAGDDIEILTWFARLAQRMSVYPDALDALRRAVDLAPQRADLILLLSRVALESGDSATALKQLRGILNLENPGLEAVREAAQMSLELGDAPSAAACLEWVQRHSEIPNPEVLRALASAYTQCAEYEKSMVTLDQAIRINPGELRLYLDKADLLRSQNQVEAAQAVLERALELHPHNPQLHLRIARILRSYGQIPEALDNVLKVVSANQQTPPSPGWFAAHSMGAELARALLKVDFARSLLSQEIVSGVDPSSPTEAGFSQEENGPPPDPSAAVDFYCLSAEMALEEGEEIAAAESLTHAIELNPDHPRVVALQARLTLRRGDHHTADQMLQTTLELTRSERQVHEVENSTFPALAAAAIEFRNWDIALDLLRKAIEAAPREAFLHVERARTLVLRAEYQHLCRDLDVVTHAPGENACSDQAYQAFEEALNSALRELPAGTEDAPEERPEWYGRWEARGLAIFKPSRFSLGKLENLPRHLPEDWAARIALLHKLDDMATIAQITKAGPDGSSSIPKHPSVLAQLALSLGSNGRRQNDLQDSFNAAKGALDQNPGEPLYHLILARLAQRGGDFPMALRSVQTALSIWPEEPRWQSLAAGLHLESQDAPAAIVHLKKAIRLEPHYLSHHLALGKAFLEHGDIEMAIQTFEHARRINPRDERAALYLARLYFSSKELDKAAQWCQDAISLAPASIEALLLRAEIALQAGEFQEALQNALRALEIDPKVVLGLQLQSHALRALGRSEEALSLLEQAIELSEQPLPLMLERIDLLRSSQADSQALRELQDLAEQYPEEAAILARLAEAYAAGGSTDEAIRTAQQALRSDTLEDSHRGRMLYLLGRLLHQSGQLDQAIYQLNETIQLNPGNIPAYLELADTHLDRREHNQALEIYQRAIKMDPQDPRPYYQAGMLLKESRDYQGAEEMLRRAAHLAHDDLNIHRQLGALVALNLVHSRKTMPIDL